MSFLDGCSEHTDRSGHRQSTIAGGVPACSFVDEEKPCVFRTGLASPSSGSLDVLIERVAGGLEVVLL
jgi:hypothetical protein